MYNLGPERYDLFTFVCLWMLISSGIKDCEHPVTQIYIELNFYEFEEAKESSIAPFIMEGS